MTRPRVLMTIGSLRRGGAERQLVGVAKGLAARGWTIKVLLLRYEGEMIKELEREGVEVFSLDLPKFRKGWNPLRILMMPAYIHRFRLLVKQSRAHIVHSWLFHTHVLCGILRPKIFIASRRQVRSDTASDTAERIYRHIARRARCVVVNSESVARYLESSWPRVQRPPFVVIRNGLDLSLVDPIAPVDFHRRIPNVDFVALCVAGLLKHKGHLTLLEAWRTVERAFPRAHLVLAGADGGMLRRLENFSRESGLTNVHFLGERSDVIALMKGADLLVHPSLDEGMPNAVMEAMACGTAVVATDVGGTAELVVDGDTGVLVPPGDAPALAAAMLDSIRHHDRRVAMGRRGRARIERDFSLESVLDRFECMYIRAAKLRPPA